MHLNFLPSVVPFLLAAVVFCSPASAVEAVFVEKGKPVRIHGSVEPWQQRNGTLQASGTNVNLTAGLGIGEGDFRVVAELTLTNLDNSAATILIGSSYFGFEGAHGKMFLTGELFDNARGLPIGDPSDFLKEGVPFKLEVARQGDQLTISIDEKLVYERKITRKALGRIALFPWRATMHVAEFRAVGNLDEKLATSPGSEPLTTKEIAGVDKIRLLPPTSGNPRNSEGDFIQLKDGRVLFVYTHFTGGGSDHATAHLAGRFSSDGGKTWTAEDVLVVENESGMNVMSVSLLRLQSGEIALFYLAKESLTDCRPRMRISRDEAKTWSEPIVCIAEPGYNVLNNDRAVQLKSGRIILPVARHNTPEQNRYDRRGVISCHFSDDQGKTWIQSRTVQQGEEVILQEPGIVELKDGRLMMFCRTGSGSQYVAYSADQGDTWTEFQPSNIISPMSPATIERIPKTGDLVLVWNDHSQITPELRGRRTPFKIAISRDEGATWEHVKTLENDPHGWYCYTAIDFVGDHLLLGHCAGDRRVAGLETTQITRIPLDWLYQSPSPSSGK